MAVLSRRWATAIIFAILTTVGVVASVASVWTHRVLFDTDTWVETVGPIGSSPVVTTALADRFSRDLIDWLDAENRLESFLPPILSPLAEVGARSINDAVVDETDRFFQSEFFANAWVNLNETAHPAAVAIIRDEAPGVSTAGGVVTVDLVPVLSPIVDNVFARIEELEEGIPDALLDQVDIDETVTTIIAAYEEEGLPEWLNDVQVYSSKELATVQQTVALLDALMWVLPFVTPAFAVAAIYLAPDRGWMAAILLGAAALGWLVAWLGVEFIVDSIVSGIDSETGADVAAELFEGVTTGLNSLLLTLAVIAGVGSFAVGARSWYTNRQGGRAS